MLGLKCWLSCSLDSLRPSGEPAHVGEIQRGSLLRAAQPAQMMVTPEIRCRAALWDQTARGDAERNKEPPALARSIRRHQRGWQLHSAYQKCTTPPGSQVCFFSGGPSLAFQLQPHLTVRIRRVILRASVLVCAHRCGCESVLTCNNFITRIPGVAGRIDMTGLGERDLVHAVWQLGRWIRPLLPVVWSLRTILHSVTEAASLYVDSF